MSVRVASVVVIDRDPVEPGINVGLHVLHEITGGRSMIRELGTLFARHDEAELVAVPPASFQECMTILDILGGRVDLALFSVLRNTIALQIAKMRVDSVAADELTSSGGTGLGIELHDPSLDCDPP